MNKENLFKMALEWASKKYNSDTIFEANEAAYHAFIAGWEAKEASLEKEGWVRRSQLQTYQIEIEWRDTMINQLKEDNQLLEEKYKNLKAENQKTRDFLSALSKE